MSRLPDFIVIGAAKAGTTSLCDDLARDPGVFITKPKEPEFFCRDEKYALGLDWYSDLFLTAEPNQLAGEGSTMYANATAFPGVPQRIRQAVPNAKLVYLVREPTARAHSYWVQKLKNQQNFGGDTDFPNHFEEAMQAKPEIITGSDYRYQLELYLQHFPREQIHVMLFEDYTKSRPAALARLGAFLDINTGPLAAMEPVKSNESRAHFQDRARTKLADDLKRNPVIKAARAVVPKTLRQRILDSAFDRNNGKASMGAPAPLSPETRRAIWEQLEESVTWLEDFLDRDLNVWRERHTQPPGRHTPGRQA